MYRPKIIYSPNRPVTTIKLCSQCKFYKPILFKNTGLCTICGDIDVITGKKESMDVGEAREHLCGEDANYFIPGPHEFPDIIDVIAMLTPSLTFIGFLGVIMVLYNI